MVAAEREGGVQAKQQQQEAAVQAQALELEPELPR
jgi:hypothetical protein